MKSAVNGKPRSEGEELMALHIRAEKLPTPERECAHCKGAFTPKRLGGRHKGLYCSRECSMASRKVTCSCAACGKQFPSARSDKKFCSPECKSAKGDRNPSWNGGKETRNCPQCRNSFQAFPSQPRKHCSAKCANEARTVAVGEANPNWRGGGKRLTCKNCGSPFDAPHSRENASYCSKACFVQHSFKREAPRWSKGSRFGMSGTKSGKRADIGIYVRSAWEANYARYLNFLIRAKQIASWEYEAETFEFPVKRGTRFYTPDFRVTLPDGRIEYHEVKGWMHQKGKTALARMARHHPAVKIVLIQQAEYRDLARRVGALIPNWEK